MSLGVVGSRRGFRVVLHGKNRVLAVLDPFHCSVIEVEVGDLERLRTGHTARFAPHREAMVLRCDKYLSCREIAHRMVSPPMAIWQLDGLAAHSQTQQLV